MIGIVQIPQENIETVWNLVDDSITKALAYSGHHFNTTDVHKACLDGENQLWLAWDGIVTGKHALCTSEVLK